MPDVRPAGFAAAPPGHGLDRYRGQSLTWRGCGEFRCASLLVPLDYDHPDDQAITLTIGMRPATGTARGTVLANPGGPGGSGLNFLASNPTSLADVNLVSWDPRGAGASTPVRCWSDAEADAYAQLDLSPDDDAERTALVEGAQRLGLSCLQGSGALLSHLSSADSARDMDLIRDALGLPRLDYLGLSNGTLLGVIYAQLFPSRVGRFVLDGAVNLGGSHLLQLQGFDRALKAWATWCADQPSGCPLGTSEVAVIGTITGWWTTLDRAPLIRGGQTLTQTLAAVGVLQGLYGGEAAYPALLQALDSAVNGHDPMRLLAMADRLLGRGIDGHWTQFAFAYPASRCADATNTGIADAWSDARTEARRAPIFGPVVGTDVECALWPVKAPAVPAKLTDTGVPPIVVIGTTGDPATPYEWALAMARQLHSAVLVTHRGSTHTAFGSACYDSVVRPYLLDGTVPAARTVC